MFPVVVLALSAFDPNGLPPFTVEQYQAATDALREEADRLVVQGMAQLYRVGRQVPVAWMGPRQERDTAAAVREPTQQAPTPTREMTPQEREEAEKLLAARVAARMAKLMAVVDSDAKYRGLKAEYFESVKESAPEPVLAALREKMTAAEAAWKKAKQADEPAVALDLAEQQAFVAKLRTESGRLSRELGALEKDAPLAQRVTAILRWTIASGELHKAERLLEDPDFLRPRVQPIPAGSGWKAAAVEVLREHAAMRAVRNQARRAVAALAALPAAK